MPREIDYSKYLVEWPSKYCRTEDPIERRRVLDLAIERGIDPEGNEIRLMLWNLRYPKGLELAAKGKDVIDTFIRSWMMIDVNSENVNSFFGKGIARKKIEKQLAALCHDAVKPYGELGEQIYYEEMFHLIYFYVKLCAQDKVYGTVVLGLGRMPIEDYANKIAQNFYRVCHKPAIAYNMQEEFSVLQKAAEDVYFEFYPRYMYIYDKVLKNGVK